MNQPMKDASSTGRYATWRNINRCPFCAGIPRVYITEKGGLVMSAQVRCTNCGASGPVIERGINHCTQQLEKIDPGTTALTMWCNRKA